MAKKDTKPRIKHTTILITVLAALLLLIANSGFWVTKYVFNSENFAEVTTESLTSDESRAVIASAVTDKIYADRPLAARVLREPTMDLLQGMLNSQVAHTGLNKAAERLNILITSQDKSSIAIDLTGVKNVLGTVANVTNNQDKLDVNSIPDEIVLLDGDKLPNFYSYSLAVLWISPLALIGAIVALVWPYARRWWPRDKWPKVLVLQGTAITLVGILGLTIGPLFKPLVLGNITNSLPRTVVGNLYDDFLATFNAQTMYMIVGGLLVVAVAVGILLYGKARQTARRKS